MVWYISNISDQSDHCSKHQLDAKSQKKLSKRGLLQKEMNKGWCRSVYVHLTVLSSGRCSVFVLLHPTLCLPAVQQRWTRRESCDKGSFSLLHHHPLRGSASPAKVSSSPTTSLWPQNIPYMGQCAHCSQHQPTPPNHIPPLYSKLRHPPARNPALSLGHGQPGPNMVSPAGASLCLIRRQLDTWDELGLGRVKW